MPSVCWTTSGGLIAMLMAVSLHQYHHSLLVHSAHSLSVKMPLFMWRAFGALCALFIRQNALVYVESFEH